MSGFLSYFRFGEHRTSPDLELKDMLQAVKPTPLHTTQKSGKLGPAIVTTLSGMAVDSAVNTGIVKAVGHGIQEVVLPAATKLKTTITSSLPSVDASFATGTIAESTNFVYQGASELFSYGASAAKLGMWGFKMLPNGVQLGIGLMGLYWAYSWWRQGSANGQNVHININFNGTPVQTPQITQNGNTTDITLPQTTTPGVRPAQLWKQATQEILTNLQKEKEEKNAVALERWSLAVKTVQNRIGAAAALHKKLQEHREKQSNLLAPHKEKMDAIIERFQKIEASKYAEPDVISLVADTRKLMVAIEKTLLTKQQEVIQALKRTE